MRLPDRFIQTLKHIHKERAEEWLCNFGNQMALFEQKWGLSIHEPFDLSFNFVAPATRKNREEVVVKAVLSDKEFRRELEVLKRMKGSGMVKLLEYDQDQGVMLLERLRPGYTLAEVEDEEEAARIASHIMKSLWVTASHHSDIETVMDRENSLKRIARQHTHGFGPISSELICTALKVFKQLNREIQEPYLLHGDLHHYNILKNGHSWMAIDPKGLIGDREYDVIQYLLNNLPETNQKEIIEKRIHIFVEELDLVKERVLLRGFSHAVLSTCWTVEDGNFNEKFFGTIEIFQELCRQSGLEVI
ncbi:aminoglycoside phosphotransferase family protein [Fictibacillus phosphorivorans]|uniref:aminoglycoside phosphotransferase family protein n=1 Tax=Fictibacillus phosphorivorans TaxID=1221500 RepID=UPI0020415C08|nr:aminoglycoside phosphotransferase family protein [Fictibacillus phosphorivorans]MCM3718058.1 aminoglycoside phosphotransferase family protein [Fictibacillus phosphorivorans]MCM3775685.1 aminoglycoside phosphotransferase family protein [Fictibacillus phosphorivorans]